MPAATPTRLSLPILIAYALPALPPAMLALPLVLYLPAFYAVDVGLGFAIVGSALFLVRLLDIASAPLAGWASDRTRTRWGRRRPWLVPAALGVIAATWWLAHPPPTASAVFLGTLALLVYLGWSAAAVPHLAWGAELVADYHGRTRLMAARAIAALCGVALSAALPTILPLPVAEAAASEAAMALQHVAAAVALAWPVSVIVALRRVPEPAAPGTRPGAGLGLVFANRPLRRLLAAYFCSTAASALPGALLPLFVTYIVAVPEHIGLVLIIYFVGAIAGVPLWVAYARRQGKHRAWCLALLFSCVAFAAVPLLGHGDLVAFLTVSAAAGVAFAADIVLPAAIQADVADAQTAMDGHQRTGLYFGLLGAMGKLAVALSLGLAVPLLGLIGFGATNPNPAAGLYELAALFAVPAVILKFAAIAALWSFPLDAGVHAELRRRIGGRNPGL